jgi:predicted Rossmann fold flavoprotein
MKIAIIGAGPSGMSAALQAAWQGASVTLLERNPAVGKKLLVTGSGRCNLTNQGVSAGRYICAEERWMGDLLARFGVEDLLAFLRSIGVVTTHTSDGWYYPISDSAQTVVDAFSSALATAGVELHTGVQVLDALHQGDGFQLSCLWDGSPRQMACDRLIVAAGGKASPHLGSKGELFPALEKFGHTVIPLRPALAPVLADLGDWKALQGVRLDAAVTLWDGRRELARTAGNMIVTEWGLNGPAVMDLSHAVDPSGQRRQELSIHLLHFFEDDCLDLLRSNRTGEMAVRVWLGAFLPPKVVRLYLRLAGVSETASLRQTSDGQIDRLLGLLRDTRLPVRGLRGFEYCQVSAGGVPVREVDAATLQSTRVRGLYLVGETLDVVGPCGGYNLHYAFASGALAGRASAGQS